MALSALHLFLLTLSLFSVSLSAARPCKSFFYTATTSFQDPSPNFNILLPFDDTYPSNSDSPNLITFFFNPINIPQDLPDQPSIDYLSLRRYPLPRLITNYDEEDDEEIHDFMPMGFYHPRMAARNSVRNRMKDIMSVVGAMLFGVGCGALTAATMYFVWSLFYADRFDIDDVDSDSDDGFDGGDDVGSKKFGYVIIPDDDIDAIKKAAQAQAKAMAETA